MRVVVVVLPSLPVTPIILHGHSDMKISISLVIMIPLSAAALSCGSDGFMPGERKIIS